MAQARKVIDGSDHESGKESGTGYVLYPFGRKVHSAQCDSVPGMALNPKEPRWFAADDDTPSDGCT